MRCLIQEQVKDGPPSHVHISQVYSDGSKYFQGFSRREEGLLAQLRGGRSLLLRETRKSVQGTDSTCSRCWEEEEDLELVFQRCPKVVS
jgi:hypothetical protein